MLETFISSRIRRTLLEYILTHPSERFYLRGLAKELGLPISPLRRELKRLEFSLMLRVEQEGNILFYTVNTASPDFIQLQQALRQGSPAPAVVSAAGHGAHTNWAAGPAIPLGTIAAPAHGSVWQSPLRSPVLVGATAVGLAVVVLIGALVYIGMTRQHLASDVARVIGTPKAEVTVVVPESSASGVMRGARWRITPGGFGGFSSGASHDTY